MAGDCIREKNRCSESSSGPVGKSVSLLICARCKPVIMCLGKMQVPQLESSSSSSLLLALAAADACTTSCSYQIVC